MEEETYCEICSVDGDEEVVAVGSYVALDKVFYFVCEKHYQNAVAAGLKAKKFD